MKVWVCLVRNQAFVGGESQRCRHSEMCENCDGKGLLVVTVMPPKSGTAGSLTTSTTSCSVCNGIGQVSECGEMELIGGEPVEWCVVHGAPGVFTGPNRCLVWVVKADDNTAPIPCQFESQIRVGP